jgi:iron complex outermembrane receptor protein
LATGHDVTWGLGLRHVRQSLDGNFNLTMTPNEATSWVYSGFVQDEIRLNDDWQLTLGSKLEHNDVTGVEVQPSARLLWRATPDDSFWGALSRSVQTPSVAMTAVDTRIDIREFPMVGRAVLAVLGDPNLRSEEVVSRELGYRGQWGAKVNVDAALFYNTHKQVFSREMRGLSFEPYPVVSLGIGNQVKGTSYGAELAANWQVSNRWQLRGSYSWFHADLEPAIANSEALPLFGEVGSSPQHMFQLHSLHNLGHNLELDANLYYTSALELMRSRGLVRIKNYTGLDLRLGWRARPDLEINLIGRNLLARRHSEFEAEDMQGSEVPRSLLLQAKWAY